MTSICVLKKPQIWIILQIVLFSLVFTACGPKPEIKVEVSKSFQEVWDGYKEYYNDIHSLAFSGNLTIAAGKVYDCKLQLIYASPDSFAFLTEGTLGIDLARGAIIGDSGFWEIPREKFHETIECGDRIFFEDGQFWIDIEQLLQAVFFFRDNSNFRFEKQLGSRNIYTYTHDNGKKIIEINRNSLTPVRQILCSPSDTVFIEYYDWNRLPVSRFPGRMTIDSRLSGAKVEYVIKKLRVNPDIKLSNFLPKS